MKDKQVSVLVTKEYEIELEAYGKNKADAFGTAFAALKKKAYSMVDGLIIHMEPETVYLLADEEQSKVEKLVGFFKPRQLRNHYVKFRVKVIVKYIPL